MGVAVALIEVQQEGVARAAASILGDLRIHTLSIHTLSIRTLKDVAEDAGVLGRVVVREEGVAGSVAVASHPCVQPVAACEDGRERRLDALPEPAHKGGRRDPNEDLVPTSALRAGCDGTTGSEAVRHRLERIDDASALGRVENTSHHHRFPPCGVRRGLRSGRRVLVEQSQACRCRARPYGAVAGDRSQLHHICEGQALTRRLRLPHL